MVLFQTKLRSPSKWWWPAAGLHSHSWSGSALTKFEFRIMKGRKFYFIKIQLKCRSNSEKKTKGFAQSHIVIYTKSFSFYPFYYYSLNCSPRTPEATLRPVPQYTHLFYLLQSVETPGIKEPCFVWSCRNHTKKPLGGLRARSQLRMNLSRKHKNLSSIPNTQRVGGIQVWKCAPINPRMGETETSVIFLASQFTRVQM